MNDFIQHIVAEIFKDNIASEMEYVFDIIKPYILSVLATFIIGSILWKIINYIFHNNPQILNFLRIIEALKDIFKR